MMKLLNKYNDIMTKYKNGEFGNDNLTMHEILERAGEADLFEKMNLSEIEVLINQSTGLAKNMFCIIKSRKVEKIKKMELLEKELLNYDIPSYCGDDISGIALANSLKLDVKYCKNNELPNDVEAMLSPTENDSFNGIIMILDNSRFSFMHEIIHYFRDVGVGKRVAKEYTRKMQGKTDSNEEQEINYLAAAVIMPFKKIVMDLKEFENVSDSDMGFWSRMSNKYEQSQEAIMRRFIEIRNIIDYRDKYFQ